MYDGTFNGLCFIALMLCGWLIATGINDAIELGEQKTQERRARYRGIAFADMAKKRQIKGNREKLWREVDYL
jgi:hypothetical protein